LGKNQIIIKDKMTQTLEDLEMPKEKIYKNGMIWTGTFLGGPLVTGYMMAENFKAFNEPEKAKKTWIYTIIAIIVILGIIFLFPDAPNRIFPIAYSATAALLVQLFQEKNIENHISLGGKLYSWWRTIAVSVIGIVVLMIPIIIGFVVFGEDVQIQSKTYGPTHNEVLYDQSITEREVDNIAQALKNVTYFNDASTRYALVKKLENSYDIYIAIDNGVATQHEIQQGFAYLRTELQKSFPNNKIIISLFVDNINNVVKRIE